MGRTFEVLGGRTRKAPAAIAAPAAIPFPFDEPTPPAELPPVVPVDADDLPGDDNEVPFVEVGGPRPKLHIAPPSIPLQPHVETPVPGVAFHLLAPMPATAGTLSAGLIAYHRPEHPSARQFRLLADGIAAQHNSGRTPVLLFSAVSTRTAASTTVVNLAAIRAADGGGRVLVIEAARAPGSTAEQLGAMAMPGLHELLARTVPLTLAIQRSPVDGVHVIPEGNTRLGRDEWQRLPALLQQLRERFAWILVDAPIWDGLVLADWARASDSVYLVLRQPEWESVHADVAAASVTAVGGQLRGCVTIV